MAVSKHHHEGRAQLFDRLVDEDPGSPEEARPFRTLDAASLRESVRRELERLLNTRCSANERDLRARELTVVDYGLPDFSAASARDSADLRRIARAIERAVLAFEPRLRHVNVLMEQYDDNEKALFFTIEAHMVVDDVEEPVSFPAMARGKAGEIKVYAH